LQAGAHVAHGVGTGSTTANGLRILNWSLQVLAKDNVELFMTQLDSQNWDVCLFQEWSMQTEFGKWVSPRGHILITNDNTEANAGWGVAILINARWKSSLTAAVPGFRCLAADVDFGHTKLRFITAHLPPDDDHDVWMHCSDEVYTLGCTSLGKLVVGMDANVELVAGMPDLTGDYVLGSLVPRSQRAIELMYGLGLCVPSTFQERSKETRTTHAHHNGLNRQIDFLCCSTNLMTDVRHCDRAESSTYISDHYCEHMELNIVIFKGPRRQFRGVGRWYCRNKPLYQHRLSEQTDLNNLESLSPNHIADIVTKVAKQFRIRTSQRNIVDGQINEFSAMVGSRVSRGRACWRS